DLVFGVAAPERHVRPVREQLARLDWRPEHRQVESLELAGVDLDRALRVPDRDVLEAELAAGRGHGAPPVVVATRVVSRAQPRARGCGLEREVCRLDDDVVVAKRLPLLESHERGILAGALALTAADPAT